MPAHDCRKDEREAMLRGNDAGDDGGEVCWMARLLGSDKSSFKEIGSKTHDRSEQKGCWHGLEEVVERRRRGFSCDFWRRLDKSYKAIDTASKEVERTG